MDTRAKYLLVTGLLLALLAGLLVAMVFLFRQQKSTSSNRHLSDSQTSSRIEPILARSTDPARMSIAADQSRVEWEIAAKLIAPLESRGDFLTALVNLEGDANKTPIRIWFGPQGTPQLVGGLAKDTTKRIDWTMTDLDQLPAIVPLNQPVKIYLYNFRNNDSLEEINQYRDYWQDINNQISRQGKVDTTLITEPDLWLYSNKIGIDI